MVEGRQRMAKLSMRSSAIPLALAAVTATTFATAQQSTSDDAKKSMAAQAERAGVILDRGAQPHYAKKFDLSDLPHYVPGKQLTGWIRLHGSNYLVDGKLGEYWQEGFAKYQPRLRISYYLPTAAIAF